MFAVLGEISFELLDSPEGFESSRTWDYAEHRVVEARPRLQWLAEGLETIELDFQFHASFTNPSAQLDALIAAAGDHNARPLVFGNGVHRGYFIVTSIRTTSQQMNASGSLIAITVRAELKEWALEAEIDPAAPPVAPFPLIGIVAAPAGIPTSSVAYTAAAGLGAAVGASVTTYVPPRISAPGISPILNIPGVAGLTSPHLTISDVPPSVIVRGAR